MTWQLYASGSSKRSDYTYTAEDQVAVRAFAAKVRAALEELRAAAPDISASGNCSVPTLPGGTVENLPL